MRIDLKAITNADEAFLFEVYSSTRNQEVDAWGWSVEQKQIFLEMQWRAQHASYKQQFPDASNSIIVVDNQCVGRLLIKELQGYHHLIDISLLPIYQGKGIGTYVINELLQKASKGKKAVILRVFQTNPARNLYERLGFRVVSVDELYLKMRWQ
ncbi:GNAT family N-acetyltransferase [Lysinibacillus sp. NPDC093712]|uniref:GNAT family N-acetyltransferase n=1 Tax=Lysinibacillus sp. NPDC093712 TaxID=3390579 RepID=UPI003D041506